MVSPAPGPAQVLAAKEDRQQLWQAAGRILGPSQRTALWLHYVEQMPAAQIGRVLGRSRAAVKTMLCRARRKLYPLLRERATPRPLDVEVSHGR